LTDDAPESPGSAADLYLAAAPDEVELARPIFTRDVFNQIEIPGTLSTGLAIVLTHPCSMRKDGVNLAERLLMARVKESAEVPLHKWSTGHFKVMPLPGLMGAHYSASFDDIGLVPSDVLGDVDRVACLTPFGINLLQQRFIWHLTRFLAPTHRLGEASEAVFEEAELCEEWVAIYSQTGALAEDAAHSFHKWIREADQSGSTRQQLLKEPQHRAGVRRDMRSHLRSR